MPTLDVLSLDKKKVGTIELSDTVFGADVNVALVHQVLKAQRANRRQGTASTKTKGLIRGGGKKPYKQKGTGNARRGSQRSPLVVGGGQNFGPQPRSYEQATPKKMIAGALRSALSDRVKAGRVLVIDSMELPSIKTKPLRQTLETKLNVNKTLMIDDENRNLELSARNIPYCKVLRTQSLNVYDLVRNEWILISKRAATAIDQRLGEGAKAPSAESVKAAPKAKKTASGKAASGGKTK